MKRVSLTSVLIVCITLVASTLSAQVDEVIRKCTQHIVPPYVSDGQEYKALLNEDETAEFHATFYGGSTYRISSASSLTEGNLVFKVYDKERNLLFSNSNYDYSNFWDFKFVSTVDCIIEAQLDSKTSKSGFVILLIGFKQ